MMKISKDQAIIAANVFSDYFDRFDRIDQYMREQKLDAMRERAATLLGMGPEEDLFSDFDMSPADMKFELIELPQKVWDTYLNIISSLMNMSSIPGRSILLAVKETTTDKFVGFIRLGSPFINCKPRNEMLGSVFTQSKTGAQRFNHCAMMGFVIVPTQPFGFNYLGGKLLAAICTSHTVREMMNKKYNMETCLFETTSLYGSTKSVSQYDGMKPYLRFKGLTVSDFMPMLPTKEYTDLKHYIEGITGERLTSNEVSSKKMKRTNIMLSIIRNSLKGEPQLKVLNDTIKKAKGLTEQKRYFVSDYGFENMVDFVNGKDDTLIRGENYDKFELDNIIEWWRKKAINRYNKLKSDGRIRTEQEVWTTNKEIDIIR